MYYKHQGVLFTVYVEASKKGGVGLGGEDTNLHVIQIMSFEESLHVNLFSFSKIL